MLKLIKPTLTVAVCSIALSQVVVAASPTVQSIQERGTMLCSGHNGSYFGFVEVNDKNEWKGLDIDICHAVTTAILGDPEKAKIVPLSWAQRFPALQSGDVDIIIKATGWTMGRDTELGLQFSTPYFFGGTQVMAHADSGVQELKDLEGGTICVEAGTTNERLIADKMASLDIDYNIVSYEKSSEVTAAYQSGRCDAFGGWGPSLAVLRSNQMGDPSQNVILKDTLSNEPIAAAMRQGDDGFVDLVNWTLAALMIAEEHGVTQANVDDMAANPVDPTVARLLGSTPGIGERLGLRETWAKDVIKSVGNFSEIYERNLGQNSPYKLERGFNNLWNNGGLLYSPILD
ncbi:amino acid ABC transporter substrate-binding protein [Marinomonas algicola]|uniref:amino acid ABC transporter substrate-binding protein n=1 Tax=Marinomonas algicola TaxID=2773454 RepID=UPI00174827C5|nr:amino acid ABC transporter substrate-binding protein [Marinomonas algicola]